MATSSGNKLIPIFAAVAVLIVGVVMVKQCSAPSPAVKPGEPLTQVPSPLPEAKGADGDTPTETLATVVASNKELREQVRQVIEENRRLRAENSRLERGGGKFHVHAQGDVLRPGIVAAVVAAQGLKPGQELVVLREDIPVMADSHQLL